MANMPFNDEIHAIVLFFRIVLNQKERISVQMHETHTQTHLDKAIRAFIKIEKKLIVI